MVSVQISLCSFKHGIAPSTNGTNVFTLITCILCHQSIKRTLMAAAALKAAVARCSRLYMFWTNNDIASVQQHSSLWLPTLVARASVITGLRYSHESSSLQHDILSQKVWRKTYDKQDHECGWYTYPYKADKALQTLQFSGRERHPLLALFEDYDMTITTCYQWSLSVFENSIP